MSVLIYLNIAEWLSISSLDFTPSNSNTPPRGQINSTFVVVNFQVTVRDTILFKFSMQFILLRSSAAEKAVYHLHRNIIIRKIHTGSELQLSDVFCLRTFSTKGANYQLCSLSCSCLSFISLWVLVKTSLI